MNTGRTAGSAPVSKTATHAAIKRANSAQKHSASRARNRLAARSLAATVIPCVAYDFAQPKLRLDDDVAPRPSERIARAVFSHREPPENVRDFRVIHCKTEKFNREIANIANFARNNWRTPGIVEGRAPCQPFS